MSLHIAGMGWVTPLGSGVEEVWSRLLNGERASAETLSSPLGRDYSVFRVPASATPLTDPPRPLGEAARHERVRDSSRQIRTPHPNPLPEVEGERVRIGPT